ncbi:MAG: haloacid dehalogenase type II [Caldilineaceae bacterium]
MSKPDGILALTFDLFGTVLDLGTSLRQPIGEFLRTTNAELSVDSFWADWRTRQRLEQYRDSLMMLGHSGYLETVRRAMVYVAESHGIEAGEGAYDELMSAWWELSPFPEAVAALERMKSDYRLAVLSNGDPAFLNHLVANRVGFAFDDIFSVTSVGAFKPHPAVYRGAALQLGLELGQCLMVSSNSFDVIGARACGMRAAYVNRYGLPLEPSPFSPDTIAPDFTALADQLLSVA